MNAEAQDVSALQARRPSVAAVFPGQGSERPGSGTEWLGDPLVGYASECAGVDVRRALERFSADLRRTSVLQPAIVALSLVAWRRARATGVRASLVCGHSVGELAAWAAAGAIDEREAVRVAAIRGRAMERAALVSPGAMIAVPSSVDVTAIAGLELAARNGPSQRVYSGSDEAIAAAARVFGGRRLEVSGPWHSGAMAAAEPEVRAALATLEVGSASSALVTCLDGRRLPPDERPDLVAQLTQPVAWDAVMATLAAEGVTDVICLAPGRTSRALLRDGLGARTRLHLIESDADCHRLQAALGPHAHEGTTP